MNLGDLGLEPPPVAPEGYTPRRCEPPPSPEPLDAFAELSRWAVTDEQVEMMEETRIIWREQIALSHLQVWSGAAGSGKTAIAKLAAADLAQHGYLVFFLQEDAPAGDLPALHAHAKHHGYTLLNSTLSGSSTEAQLDVLNRLVHGGAYLANYVLIFDTLKKFCTVMSKDATRSFFVLMRGLTQRGATVLLLSHQNKHLGPDGKPVFEGVGDVRNDCDDLIYVEATDKDPQGVRTVTLRPDKTRCRIQPATFTIDTRDMTVRALDRVIDVAEIERNKRQREEDAAVIQAIDDALAAGGVNRSELIESAAAASGYGSKVVRRVLDRYCSEADHDVQALWLVTYMRFRNTRHVTRNPNRPPSEKVRTGPTNQACRTGRTDDTASYPRSEA